MTTKAVTWTQRCLILNQTFLHLRTSMVLGKVTPTCHICCCAIIWFHSSAFSLIMFAFAGSASFPTYQASFTNHFQLSFIHFLTFSSIFHTFPTHQASFTNHFQESFWLTWLLCSFAVRYEGQKAVSQGRPYGLLWWDFISKVFTLASQLSSPLDPLCAHGSCWLLWARRDGKVSGTVV